MRGCALWFSWLLMSTIGSAAPFTVACDLASTTTYATLFIEADQFVYDPEAQSVDMRSAKTVGTADLVNWLFVSREDGIFNDRFVLSGDETGFAGAGLYSSIPIAMQLMSDGKLTMTYIDRGTSEVIVWQCRR